METAIIKLCADARAKRDRKYATAKYLYFSMKVPAEWQGSEKFIDSALDELEKTYHLVGYTMDEEFIVSYRLKA